MDQLIITINDRRLRIGTDGSVSSLTGVGSAELVPDAEATVGQARLKRLEDRSVRELIESGALLRALSFSGDTDKIQEFYYLNLARLLQSDEILLPSEVGA